jgi:hypothetical protein
MLFSAFSLSACSEDDDDDFRQLKPIYEDSSAPDNEKEPQDDGPSAPTPDDTFQRITKISLLMDQFSSSKSMQGSAVYGSILFQFVANNYCIFVYDIEKKEYLGTIYCKSNNKWHNNQATFSHTFYEESDEFPLLYTSQIHPDEQSIQVWRIMRNDNLFELQLVQSLRLPVDTDENNLYHFNMVIDDNDEYFYLYSRNRTTSMGQISKWELPDPHISKLSLTEENMLEHFSIEVNMRDAQGGNMIGQRIYFVQGVPGRTDLRMHIVNVNTQEVTSFNLRDYNFGVEPEGLSFNHGRFICTTNRVGIFEIYLNTY